MPVNHEWLGECSTNNTTEWRKSISWCSMLVLEAAAVASHKRYVMLSLITVLIASVKLSKKFLAIWSLPVLSICDADYIMHSLIKHFALSTACETDVRKTSLLNLWGRAATKMHTTWRWKEGRFPCIAFAEVSECNSSLFPPSFVSLPTYEIVSLRTVEQMSKCNFTPHSDRLRRCIFHPVQLIHAFILLTEWI